MIGREARDNPFFFANADEVVFGMSRGEIPGANKKPQPPLSPLEDRVKVLRAYADYAMREQAEFGTSRETLLIPTNQLFHGLKGAKQTFAHSIRSTPKHKRPRLLGQELLAAADLLSGSGSRGFPGSNFTVERPLPQQRRPPPPKNTMSGGYRPPPARPTTGRALAAVHVTSRVRKS